MTFSDETLMAYIDGELEAEARAAVERAIAADPVLARRIERERRLRSVLRSAYDGVLEEHVPERLISAARNAHPPRDSANVIALRRPNAARPERRALRGWTAIAASLLVGAVGGQLLMRQFQSGALSERSGKLLAHGELAAALTTQLAADHAPGAAVQVGISFISKTGEYCRTFTLEAQSTLAGLACRESGGWQIQALAASTAARGRQGPYRQAASNIPPAILAALGDEIAGEPLDAHAEAAARARGWRR